MKAKLIITFSPLSGPDFLIKAGTIVDALRANPNSPELWPAQVSSFSQLETAYNAYRDALHAAANRDRIKIAEQYSARETLTGILRSIAGYLEVIAQGNTTRLAGSGYDLARISSATPAKFPPPRIFGSSAARSSASCWSTPPAWPVPQAMRRASRRATRPPNLPGTMPASSPAALISNFRDSPTARSTGSACAPSAAAARGLGQIRRVRWWCEGGLDARHA